MCYQILLIRWTKPQVSLCQLYWWTWHHLLCWVSSLQISSQCLFVKKILNNSQSYRQRYLTLFTNNYMMLDLDNNTNMFISYSWYKNEMVQIQMENMPKKLQYTCIIYEQYTEWRGYLSFKTIRIFDITVQQYLITCNFPNQIRQFGWIKYWQVITIVFTCCELFYRSYSITCFNINSAGSVFAQIIIGAIP